MKSILYILSLITFFTSCKGQKEKLHVDFLITDALIIDGSGKSAYSGTLAISGDSIVWIGQDYSSIESDSIIEAKGKVLAPGFIDPHAHGSISTLSQFENFKAQGVTTVALGQDGDSILPEDWDKFANQVDSVAPPVNVISFIGHAALRESAGIPLNEAPDSLQLLHMLKMIERVMEKGAFGMSTGLEYIPGYYSDENELFALAMAVGAKDGLIMSHLRNEDDDSVNESLRELIRQGQFARVQVSHMKIVYGKGEERAEELLEILDSAREAGIDIRADIYPYTASYTGIGIVFPDWAKRPFDYNEVLNARREELREYLIRKIEFRNGPEATLFGTAPWAGKTLAQVADSLGKHFADVLIDDIGPEGASGAYFVMNEELQEKLLKHPFSMVCSDGSPTMHHPRGYGSFAKIIREYVNEKSLLNLEEAIYKMSGLTAETLQLNDRGKLKVGYKADVILLDPAAVRENASFENPHQLAEGVLAVWINGKSGINSGIFVRKK